MVNTKYVGPNYEEIIKEAEDNPMANALLTLPQVSKILQLNIATVRRIINTGDMPYVNVSSTGHTGNKGIRVSVHDLNEWIESRRLIAWSGSTEGAKLGMAGSRTMTEERCDAALGRMRSPKHDAKLGPSRHK